MESTRMIKVGVLSSSRADYGIYLPLLKALQNDANFSLELIIFGTHLSKFHGYTISKIEADGFEIAVKIESLLIGDTPNAIASSFALTSQKFADYWNLQGKSFDIVFALGDRFEMAAAVLAGLPYGVSFAHLFGGEMTLGAIDNAYRHSISLASTYHFVSAQAFANRLKLLLDDHHDLIHCIGSLSLENLEQLELLSLSEFLDTWGIDLSIDTLLVTVHPETVAFEKNKEYCIEFTKALEVLADAYQVVITMPNADTSGLIFREAFTELAFKKASIKIIESFGTQSYFTCMKFAKLLIGNTSSGIVEAASFQKYVLNVGDRQKGRLCSENIIHLPFNSEFIISSTLEYAKKRYEGENVYYQKAPSQKILNVLKQEYASFS
jgi:GDP/UDP-N,N'-diacetylbacillosamine 2-epimerase (hydrolysing)